MGRFIQSFNMAISAIWLNRSRAVLTMLGIVIGIAAVVALVSLGRGVEDFVVGEFTDLGADILTISSGQPESETRTRIDPLTVAEMNMILAQPSVIDVGGDLSIPNVTIVANGESYGTTLIGITPNILDMQGWQLAVGDSISQTDIEQMSRVAVLGSDVASTLFPDVDPSAIIGQVLRYDSQIFEVVGVLEPAGTGVGDTDTSIVIPLSTAQQRVINARTGDSAEVSTIFVQAIDNDSAFAAELEVHFVLQAAHGITVPDERDYRIANQAGLLDSITQITGYLTIFLAVVASIALVVGGIGIMNIMLVTVTERTREIGLRKAVGAQPMDIQSQFLFESLLLALLGGIIGILVAIILTQAVAAFIPALVVSVDADAILLATSISSLVGIVFGLLPARQAARLHPIDALRFE